MKLALLVVCCTALLKTADSSGETIAKYRVVWRYSEVVVSNGSVLHEVRIDHRSILAVTRDKAGVLMSVEEMQCSVNLDGVVVHLATPGIGENLEEQAFAKVAELTIPVREPGDSEAVSLPEEIELEIDRLPSSVPASWVLFGPWGQGSDFYKVLGLSNLALYGIEEGSSDFVSRSRIWGDSVRERVNWKALEEAEGSRESSYSGSVSGATEEDASGMASAFWLNDRGLLRLMEYSNQLVERTQGIGGDESVENRSTLSFWYVLLN